MSLKYSSKLLAICRTCLDTDAKIPLFTEEMDATTYSKIVYTVTGLKVEMDDGLPQKICQNCLNSINNCLAFRKQCKDSETKLLIMKSQVKNSEYSIIQNKLERDITEIHTSNEIQQKEITLTIENTKIKKEDNVTVPNNINNKQEHFDNARNLKKKKLKLAKTVRNISDTNRVDNIEINKVRCKLCQKTIPKRKYHTHMTAKHTPTKNRTIICNVCNVYFSKNQFSNHKLTHRKNKYKEVADNDTSLHDYRSENSCNENLINTSRDFEIDKRHAEITSECLLSTSSNNNVNTLNNNSTSKSLGKGQDDDICNYKQDIEDLNNETIDSEAENNIANSNTVVNLSIENGNICNDETKQNNLLREKIDISFKDSQELENCSNEEQIVENVNNTEIDGTKTESILYNYNSENSKRVTCKLCQKDLSIRSVDSHIARSHPGADKRRVKCHLCDNYVMKSKLIRHKTLMHGPQGFICRYCKNKFDDEKGLIEHVGSCTGKKIRRNCDASRELKECEVCHKTMQKGSLKLHIEIKHAGLRPVCEHCGLCFGNKFRLQCHYRAKHGYDKFKCSHCDFQSASNMAMRNHERRHRGEKPFVCERCGAKFHAAYLLAQHRQSHAATKAYQCDLCPASFKVNNTLHMHKRACHSSRAYACTVCGRAYSARHYAVKHMRAMHRYTGPLPALAPVQ